MKKMTFIIVFITSLILSCGLFLEESTSSNIGISCNFATRAISIDQFKSVKLTVSASDLTDKVYNSTNGVFSVDVKPGKKRTFKLEVTLNNGDTYTGEKTSDISGDRTNISITLTKNGVSVTGVKINIPAYAYVKNGDVLTATVEPSDATNKSINWSLNVSSDIATINASTGELSITGISPITITATTTDGSFTDSLSIDAINQEQMVLISGGVYNQIDQNEILFEHTISPYEIGAFEVAYDLWYKVRVWAETNKNYVFHYTGSEGRFGVMGAAPSGTRFPVGNISWEDAIVWCNAYTEYNNYKNGENTTVAYFDENASPITNYNKAYAAVFDFETKGFRLPTEGEWQYASSSRGLSSEMNVAGTLFDSSEASKLSNYTWTKENSPFDTDELISAIGKKLPSSLGIYDLAGNVWEYCYDIKTNNTSTPKSNYSGPIYNPLDNFCNNRSFRGGGANNELQFTIIGARDAKNRATPNMYGGFRVVRTRRFPITSIGVIKSPSGSNINYGDIMTVDVLPSNGTILWSVDKPTEVVIDKYSGKILQLNVENTISVTIKAQSAYDPTVFSEFSFSAQPEIPY